MAKPVDKPRFDRDVKEHQMEIVIDSGVNRHVVFGRPGDSCYRFQLNTWSGFLCFSGDMGTFVFQRSHDMFAFFRGQLLNPHFDYWHEKLTAVCNRGGSQEVSEDRMIELAKYHAKQYGKTLETKSKRREFGERFNEEVLESICDSSPDAFIQTMCRFSFDGDRPFQDFWEVNIMVHTTRYRWCCYAIPWAVSVYDEYKSKELQGRDS